MVPAGFHDICWHPIKNGPRILDLLNALQLPKKTAVVKCTAHKSGDDMVSLGNNFADKVAKCCALMSLYIAIK